MDLRFDGLWEVKKARDVLGLPGVEVSIYHYGSRIIGLLWDIFGYRRLIAIAILSTVLYIGS